MTHEMIVETIKATLKAKKISYKMLAEEIGMSESGLKKLLTAKDISLRRLSQIATVLGVPLSDILYLAHQNEVKHVQFSSRQEEDLLGDLLLFRVLWRISVEDKSEEETMQLEGISRKKLTSCLLQLENLDLIKVTKFNKIVAVHSGLYRWVGESRLVEKLNREWSRSTLDAALRGKTDGDCFHRLSFLQLSSESKQRLFASINDLVDEFARVSRAEKLKYPRTRINPVGLLIAATPKGFLD